jgi:hypothetical protein
LVPEPDFIILADECSDYHHKISVALDEEDQQDGDKFVHVLNPGSFAQDNSFCVIYPL